MKKLLFIILLLKFEVKNCKLFAIINETDTLLLHDHAYRHWIVGEDSLNMGAVR